MLVNRPEADGLHDAEVLSQEPPLAAIPDWGVIPGILELEDVELSDQGAFADSSACPLFFAFNMTSEISAVWFDSTQGTTSIYEKGAAGSIVRQDIGRDLTRTTTTLPLPSGLPWAVGDLDLDGNLEIVVQRGSSGNGYLDIHSAPTWEMRSRAVFPGKNVYFYASIANIDEDPYLEVHASAMSLGFESDAVIVQYDELQDTFVVTDQLAAPEGSAGTSAVGDFDGDGKTEIVTGNNLGYALFEYDTSLSYVGPVGNQYWGQNRSALIVRPFPSGTPCILASHSSSTYDYRHQLLIPDGDNSFYVGDEFQRSTGWMGAHRCGTADVDCDGMSELLLNFYPTFEFWEWDVSAQAFVPGCSWDAGLYGTFIHYHTVDLNQDGVEEWGTVDHNWRFQVFTTDFCVSPSGGIAAWWPLDEQSGGISTDVWGTNDGAWVGAPVPVSGLVNVALSFDGVNDLIRIPDDDSLDFGAGDFSFESWARTTSTALNPIVAKYDNSTIIGWSLSITGGNSLTLALGDGAQQIGQSPDTLTLADEAWHHVAVSVDRDLSDGIRYFVDGAIVGTGDPSSASGSISNTADMLLEIGRASCRERV